MPKKKSILFCGTFAFCVAFSMTPALAGFQWVAPDNGNYQQPVIISGSNNGPAMATGSPEIISPVIITGDGNGNPNYVPQQQISQAPDVITAPTPIVTYSDHPNMATATIAVPANSGSVVQGFASQIPLALALRQILPVGYNFSIDQNIDMETIVSYKGGKDWRETLSDMLSTVNLTAHEQGMAITVSRMPTVQTVQNQAPMPAAVPVVATVAAPVPLDGGATVSVAHPMLPDTLVIAHSSDVPMVNVGGADGWSAQRGDTLHKVLTDWCKRAGVELQWVAEYDYPMEATASFNSDFEDAVRSLLAGFENARPQPVAELHTNASAGQKLLVVQARGNSYSN